MLRKGLIAATAIALLVTIALPANALAEPRKIFMVSPVKLEFSVKPGEEKTKTVTVANQGDVPILINTDFADYHINQNNTFTFTEPGHQSHSSARWISLNEKSFYLQPGEVKKVKITLSAPWNAEPGGRYSCVFFQTITDRKSLSMDGEANVNIVGRIGCLILTGVGNKEDIIRKGEIQEFAAQNSWSDKNVDYSLVFNNSGNVHLTLKGEVAITNIFGKKIASVPLQSITTLPGTKRIMAVQWNGPMIGRFTATPIVRYGPNLFTYNTAKTAPAVTFWIIPWMEILILSIASALAILVRKAYLAYRAARKIRSELSTPAIQLRIKNSEPYT